MSRPAILIDINGTLSDTSKVEHFLKQSPKDWVGFFENMNSVPVVPIVREIAKRFRKDHQILLISGAPESYETHTKAWLELKGVPYNRLYMRPSWDKRKGWQMKNSIYKNQIKSIFNVKLVLDDKADACKMFREHGLNCWNVGKESPMPVSDVPGQRFAHLVQKGRTRV